MNEIKKELERAPFSWIRIFNIVKIVPPNLIHTVHAISIKIPASYFGDTSKLILKFIWRGKTQKSQHNIEEEQSWRTDTT